MTESRELTVYFEHTEYKVGDIVSFAIDEEWGGQGHLLDGIYEGRGRWNFSVDTEEFWIVVKNQRVHKAIPVAEGDVKKKVVRRLKKNYGIRNLPKESWSIEAWERTKKAEKFIRKYSKWLDFERLSDPLRSAETYMEVESILEEEVARIESNDGRLFVGSGIDFEQRPSFPWRPGITGLDQPLPDDIWGPGPVENELDAPLSGISMYNPFNWAARTHSDARRNVLELMAVKEQLVRQWIVTGLASRLQKPFEGLPPRAIKLLRSQVGNYESLQDLLDRLFQSISVKIKLWNAPRTKALLQRVLYEPLMVKAARESALRATKFGMGGIKAPAQSSSRSINGSFMDFVNLPETAQKLLNVNRGNPPKT